MNRKIKISISIFVLIAVIIGSVKEWLDHPLPLYVGEKTLTGLKKNVDVYTDEYGVPHVFASNEEDLFFAAGYSRKRPHVSVINGVVGGAGRVSIGLRKKIY